MNKIRIERTTIEGFRSYIKPVAIKYDVNGLILIRGVNGAGKTSMFEALLWCLFNYNLKGTAKGKVATWKFLRDKSYIGTRVMTEFRDKTTRYLVARHLDYKGDTFGVKGENGLRVYSKAASDKGEWSSTHEVSEELYKKDQQQYICKVLGYSPEVFVNSVLFGQGVNRLMSSKASDIRELLDVIFDTSWVDGLKDKAVAKIAALNNGIFRLNTEYSDKNNRIEFYKEDILSKEELRNKYEETKSEKLAILKANGASILSEIKPLKERMAELKAVTESDDTLDEKYETLLSEQESVRKERQLCDTHLHRLEMNKITEQTQRESFSRAIDQLWQDHKNVKENCPTCSAPLKKDKVAAARENIEAQIKNKQGSLQILAAKIVPMDQEIADKKEELKTLNKQFDSLVTKLNVLRNEREQQTIANRELMRIEQDVLTKQGKVDNLKAQYQSLKAEISPDYNIDDTKRKIQELSDELEPLLNELEDSKAELERCEWWNKKAFGAGGMKSFIFSAMLGQLNETLLSYSIQFGFRVKFWIDLNKASKPFMATVYEGENEIDFADLSSGQRQRLNIAVAFSMFDIINKGNEINFMMLDEPYDNLDMQGVDMVTEIMKRKAATKAMYVIAHNPILDIDGAREIVIAGGEKRQTSIIQ